MTLKETTDAAYANRREAEERVAADGAVDSAIRDAHFQMAARYADRARSIEEGAGFAA